MSTLDVRRAGPGDLDAIAALTRSLRHRLGEWEPGFWRPAAGADELHPLWLGHLLGTGEAPARVATRRGEVVGCAFSVRQPGQWFVDDVAVAADGDWADAGAALLAAVAERPALTCVPRADRARAAATAAAGWEHVSDYRLQAVPDPGPGVQQGGPAEPGDPPPAAGLPAPPHTFGGPFDPAAPGALVVAGPAGSAVGSPAVAAPPVYDPGRTTCVVDRVAGPDLPALLDAVTAAAGALGARQLVVVCGAGDPALRAALDERRFRHPVEVFRAPS
jgi:hypothetical protein